MSMTFTLDDEQERKFLEWRASLPAASVGAIGGRVVFTFCHTNLGTVARARDDVSGSEIDLSDYEGW